MWINTGVLITHPDKYITYTGLIDSPLIRIQWLKGDVPLSAINSRFLVRRRFISGEVDNSILVYATDEPLIIPFQDLAQQYQVQIKKLMYRRTFYSEPYYQVSVDYFSV